MKPNIHTLILSIILMAVTTNVQALPLKANAPATPAATDIRSYYDDIYTLKVRRITIEKDGRSFDPGIALSDIVCGTGFMVDGAFITARSNIEPWVYREVYGGAWRMKLAEYVAAGATVVIDYEAYSTRGPATPFVFSNLQFPDMSMYDSRKLVTITKEVRNTFKTNGIQLTFKKKTSETFMVPIYTRESRNYAKLADIGQGGIPTDLPKSNTLGGGQKLTIAGYNGTTDIHNLASDIKYFTSTTSEVATNFITLQGTNSNWGFVGSPAFIQEKDGTYRVIGVMVGAFGNEDYLIPISSCQ